MALSMVGVTIAQLFRLQSEPLPGGALGYYAIGVPLGAAFILSAIVVVSLGAVRYLRQQRAMTRGKVHAGGWEVISVMGIALLVSFRFVVLVNNVLMVIALCCYADSCACCEGSGGLG